MKAVMVHLTEDQITRLHHDKDISGCSIGSQVRNALIEYWRVKDAQ
jgi:hypothetical protein